MSERPPQQSKRLPIDRLDPHPLNSNVMPKALMDKLADEVRRTGLYPPIIVRPVGQRYQILDGHHRVEVLRSIGHDAANVVVWPVDDEQAMVLLASLNRLQGEDDPRKRAALLGKLRESMPISELAKRLPEDAARVKKLLELNSAPPSPRTPTPVDLMPVCVHFFVQPVQRSAIEKKLRERGGPRESALLDLLGLPTGEQP